MTTTQQQIEILKTSMTDCMVEAGWVAAQASHPVVAGIDLGEGSEATMIAARDDRTGASGWYRTELAKLGRPIVAARIAAMGRCDGTLGWWTAAVKAAKEGK